ncbi:cadherin-like beta sandwich domain-containing protein [Candidatus Stoquefichus sp. SB1]|uniref:cadherin-like beta sandwich domain-containing protein n=1 Tax=Candidatus Stoquefichus sp. SB1 TaxID=1658109 RepID=UPI00067F6122|nr:cadherin-like beta sandwich domain-containing protein [Candidatus Stoquefichus sp. SB1]
MKKLKQIVFAGIIFCLSLGLSVNPIHAAGVSVSASQSSITIGSSFKVTVTASDCYATIHASCSNGSVKGGAADADNTSVTFTVTPSSVGVCTVKISGVYAAYSGNSDDVNYSKNVTVKVNAASSNSNNTNTNSSNQTSQSTVSKEDNRSKENALSSLTVSEGSLSPEFSANTTKYTVNLEGDKTKITINAKAKDSKAKVSGTGDKDLKIGKNTFVIKCIAENGSTRNYTIDVNVDEKPLVYLTLDESRLGVVRNLSGVEAPSSFQKGTIKIENQDVDAWTSDKLNLTICYLVDEENRKAFYVIEDGKPLYEFKRVQIDERNFIIIPIDKDLQKRDGMTFQKVTLKELELDGWVYNDQAMKNYVQVYLMNENGEKCFYNYETTEDQLQKYTEFTKTQDTFNIFIVTTGVLALGLVILGIIYIKERKNSQS